MAIKPRLELRQSQTLAMTPQLQQAIKLLQLSQLELADYIQDQLEKNPLLESADSSSEQTSESGLDPQVEAIRQVEVEAASNESNQASTGAESLPELSLNEFSENTQADLDGGQDNLFPDDQSRAQTNSATADAGYNTLSSGGGGGGSGGNFDSTEYNWESVLEHEVTLVEHLTQQLMLNINDPVQRMVGQQLIHGIDQDGYWRGNVTSLSERLGIEEELITLTLVNLQNFEPTGVFSRSLSECLALQLKENNRFDPAMEALVDNIELLARREFTTLKKLCRIDDEDLTAMIREIRELDPRPGLQFESHVAEAVVPDVFVKAQIDGTWHVELYSGALPKVLVNQSYYSIISNSANNAQDKAYISECLQDANWLVRSLDQRARTILKVASEVVRQQDAFFAYGVQHLRPLTLKTVADAIDMHESTVSRVTSNKFIETPRGVYEFKYFFTASISSSIGGEALSAESVRCKIRSLIDAELPTAVLSDDQLVQLLQSDGIDIARRTVAKYRESMKIPSSVQRRREKRLLA